MIAFVTKIHNGYPILASDLHAAEGERLVGDHTRALVDLNTAVELLIRFVLSFRL